MQKLVADAYHQVIDFSRAVAEYCCHFWTSVYIPRLWWSRCSYGWHVTVADICSERLLPAIFAATLDFDVIAKNIYRLLAEINATANLGLHARAQKIDSQLGHLVSKAGEAEDRARKAEEDHKKLLEDNKALQARLDKQERQEDERRFHLLQKMLDVSKRSPMLSLHAIFRILCRETILTNVRPGHNGPSGSLTFVFQIKSAGRFSRRGRIRST